MTILQTIVAHKREEVAARKRDTPQGELVAGAIRHDPRLA